jgi:hypothetical protein
MRTNRMLGKSQTICIKAQKHLSSAIAVASPSRLVSVTSVRSGQRAPPVRCPAA